MTCAACNGTGEIGYSYCNMPHATKCWACAGPTQKPRITRGRLGWFCEGKGVTAYAWSMRAAYEDWLEATDARPPEG